MGKRQREGFRFFSFSPDSKWIVCDEAIFDLEKEEIIWSGDFEPTPTDIYPGYILGERAMFSSDGRFFIYNRKFWKPDIINVELNQLKEKEINLETSEPL